jgi:hypothetical protein
MIGLAVFLLVLWVLGAFIFKVVGGLIHILLIVAVIVIVWRFIQGRKPIP